MSEPRPPESPALRPAAGARVIMIAQVVRFFTRFLSAAVLARLLLPGDYGLHGMAAVLYSLLYMVRDLGVFPAMQQANHTPQRFNALCRIAFLGGLGLAALCALLGRPAAWFFGEPRLPPVLAVMGLAFVFGGAAVPALAALYREKRVQAAVTVETAAVVLASLGSIAAAAAGAGVWALVLLTVLNELLAAMGAWWQCSARPGRDTRGAPWRELLGFSTHLTGHSVANYLARTIDQIIVGRAAGTVELGLYGRAAQATTLPVQLAVAPFSAWAVATLARSRNQAGEFVTLYRRLLNGLQHFSLPPAIVCLAAPGFAIRLLYGEKWLAAAEVVRWLGVALLVQPWIFTQGWLLQAVGRARRLMVVSTIAFVVVAGGCLAARQQGISAIAAAVAAGTVIQALVSLAAGRGISPVRPRDLVAPALVPLALHGGLGLVLLALPFAAPAAPWWLPLPVVAGYYTAAWLALPVIRREARGHFLLHH